MLYHLGLDMKEASEVFKSVRFIILGGDWERMKHFATLLSSSLHEPVVKISQGRYIFLKVGHVAVLNHGMGGPSIGILLNECIKGLRAASNPDAVFFRIGTSGGIGVAPGTLFVTTEAVNEKIEPFYEMLVLGKVTKHSTTMDARLVSDLLQYEGVVAGKTMSANCFYEGQGRLDGAFCEYTEQDKMDYLTKLGEHGVKNI